MRLKDAHVTNYRPVEDSEEFTIEPDVTCLVGMNESGKTAVMQAIYRSNPAEADKTFDEVIHFPSRLSGKLRNWQDDEQIPAVKLTFELDDTEVAEIERDLGAGALSSRTITVTTGYRDATKYYGLQVDEAAVVAHLRTQLDISFNGPYRAIAEATTITDIHTDLSGIEEPAGSVVKVIQQIEGWPGRDVREHIIDKYLGPWVPTFLYFHNYDAMPGKISIPDLIRRRDTDALTRGERALLSLLGMASVRPEDFQTHDNHERLTRALENAGNVITDEVFEYWSQSNQLEVELKVMEPETTAAPPLNEGPILEVRVYNRRHRASVPFDDRSSGFVWFFSFLAYFREMEQSDGDLVLLLDEPGLSLHGRAQADLLRLIEERLAPHHQVVYTTHSPFLVDPGRLQRVRTVIDHEKVGTKVSADIFKADDDTLFPVLNAMGIELTQTLFVGPHTLLLEGPSDMIYLEVLSDLLETEGKTGLDPRWVKTPIGGSGKLSTFVTLLGANKVNVAVLVDSSTKDVGAVKRLRDNGQLAANGLVEIAEFTGTPDADIEDLFDTDFYLELVNRAYVNELPIPITAAALNTHDPRIVRQIETYFKQHNIAGGKLSHLRPASTLLREQTAMIPKISATTIAAAEQLVNRLNGLLP